MRTFHIGGTASRISEQSTQDAKSDGFVTCGLLRCKKDFRFGEDGNFEPCSKCKSPLVEISEGPACSSLVETARGERRYRGAIKEPSYLGRTLEIG